MSSDRAAQLVTLGQRTAAAANLPTAGLEVDWAAFGAAVEEAIRCKRPVPDLAAYSRPHPRLTVVEADVGTNESTNNGKNAGKSAGNRASLAPRSVREVWELADRKLLTKREARAYLGLPPERHPWRWAALAVALVVLLVVLLHVL